MLLSHHVDPELRARWPFRLLAGFVGLSASLTCAALMYEAVRDPHGFASSLGEWVIVALVFIVMGITGYVFVGIAVVGGVSFLAPALRRVESFLEPTLSPVDPGRHLGASNCIRCGSYCAPETGAFIAPAAAALCDRCIHQVHKAVKAGKVASLDCLTYPDDVPAQVACSYCKRNNRPGLLAWPAGTICRSCLELAATHRKRK